MYVCSAGGADLMTEVAAKTMTVAVAVSESFRSELENIDRK
jgi:hypothetical protein